ncbi:bifunctional endoribonuclease/protein kinase ire1 [Ceratobasidium sp. 428]|nr:bifunctional endoribonuclease/protein kinase ire1 [Ceratobasidium sp. 428]
MLSTLIQLCLLLAVLCVASESYHRPASEPYHDAYHRPSTDARIRKFSSDLAAVRVSPPSERWRRGERPPMRHHPVPPAGGSSSSSSTGGDIRLVDIVLAASIDGHFHALNRTTGELLWSMTDDLSHSQSPRDPHTDSAPSLAAQSPLYNLVRSDHRALVDPDLAVQEEDEAETYVVEPQTGDIFVMASDGDMIVERLGYSVPQLVELSPFKPPGDDERMFVGKKTTSLISLDLLTGRILGVYGEQCTWDDNTVEAPDAPVDVDALLDDLDGTREMPKKQRPVEVVIGRTDYHVSVHVKGKGVVQTLAFTKYGPNNVHRAIQAAWTRSPDSIYFQPSPDNNRLFCFANGGLLRFERTYPLVVAVFDAVFLPTKRNPILLLQPTPQLSELSSAYRSAPGDMPQVTFVGRIDDSLFALSHINYPLVMFPSTPKKSVPRIDDGGKTPPGPDQTPNDERCYDLDCYVGTKRSRFASRSSLSRLLGEAHTLGIEGIAGVESEEQVAEVYPEHEIPQSHSHTWTREREREHTKTPGGVRPTPTTRNSSLPAVRSEEERGEKEEEEVPRATPSHRTVLGRVAREWVAAWAGMGTVLVSTAVFGFGLVGKGKGRSGIWRVKVGDGDEKVQMQMQTDEKAQIQTDEKTQIIMADEPDQDDEEEDDTPPPVPPKPASFSFSKMTGSPYAITADSRPADSRPTPPPKDPIEAKLKKIRPRNRAGLPSSASVPVLPDLKPVGVGNGTKSAIELAGTPVELARTALASPVELARTPVELARTKTVDLTATEGETEIEPEVGAEPETPGKRRVRRGRRGKGRGKGSKGDVGSGGDEAPSTIIAGTLSEGSETFVKVEKAVPVVTPLSSLVVTEDVLGEFYGKDVMDRTGRSCTRDASKAEWSPSNDYYTTL